MFSGFSFCIGISVNLCRSNLPTLIVSTSVTGLYMAEVYVYIYSCTTTYNRMPLVKKNPRILTKYRGKVCTAVQIDCSMYVCMCVCMYCKKKTMIYTVCMCVFSSVKQMYTFLTRVRWSGRRAARARGWNLLWPYIGSAAQSAGAYLCISSVLL